MNILHLVTSINKRGAENHLTCFTRGQVFKEKNYYYFSKRIFLLEEILFEIRYKNN